MHDGDALRIAIDLLHVPSRVRALRTEPLPHGVPLLLQIAADDSQALSQACRIADRPQELVRDAAAFFIEQVLLSLDADSYRVLGANPTATTGELRSNMACLIKYLHPDTYLQGQQSIFVNRVTMAWDDLKTPERRAAYDKRRPQSKEKVARKEARPSPARSAQLPARVKRKPQGRGGILRALQFLLRGSPR